MPPSILHQLYKASTMNETVSNDKPVHQADAVKVQPGEIVPAKVEANEKCERETPHEAKNIVIIPLILKTANANSGNCSAKGIFWLRNIYV